MTELLGQIHSALFGAPDVTRNLFSFVAGCFVTQLINLFFQRFHVVRRIAMEERHKLYARCLQIVTEFNRNNLELQVALSRVKRDENGGVLQEEVQKARDSVLKKVERNLEDWSADAFIIELGSVNGVLGDRKLGRYLENWAKALYETREIQLILPKVFMGASVIETPNQLISDVKKSREIEADARKALKSYLVKRVVR